VSDFEPIHKVVDFAHMHSGTKNSDTAVEEARLQLRLIESDLENYQREHTKWIKLRDAVRQFLNDNKVQVDPSGTVCHVGEVKMGACFDMHDVIHGVIARSVKSG